MLAEKAHNRHLRLQKIDERLDRLRELPNCRDDISQHAVQKTVGVESKMVQ